MLMRMLSIIVLTLFALPATGARAEDRPALIPLPRSLEWTDESFSLALPARIIMDAEAEASDRASILGIAAALRNILEAAGARDVTLRQGNPRFPGAAGIGLILDPVEGAGPSEEAYRLQVGRRSITLAASHWIGLFRGLQTLRQLIDNGAVAGCRVTDEPAFPLRGMMLDVGRNYISPDLIMDWVDVMAQYKMNVLHFHMTEHIAWRMEIKSHPELTAPEHMIRNPGRFYTHDELRDLQAFCAKRGIMVIPEIDMPGHSDAFTRATGVTMQSTEGMKILADVLGEVCDVFNAPIIHLGSDEVRITNKTFIAEMAAIVRARGRNVVLWRPGGPLDEAAVYQLWHNGARQGGEAILDSRDMYLNHLDWFSGVPHVFARRLCDVRNGDKKNLGGIICLWPDRRVADERDQFRMSPVAPVLMTFAERAWRGGGTGRSNRIMPEPGADEYKDFAAFEDRLIAHRDRWFRDLPCLYVRQRDIAWNVFGPFPNDGDLDAVFPPETANADSYEFNGKTYEPIPARGGTVYLGGWYDGGLYGAMQNHTACAVMHIWSDAARDAHMLIGFRSWSRSHRDDTPATGQWDHRRSRIWLNGVPIPAPRWAKPGRKGNAEDPLIDEGYAYRAPAPIRLKAGWNHILVKAPVGKDKTKWMFTAVPVSFDGERVRELEGVRYAAAPD